MTTHAADSTVAAAPAPAPTPASNAQSLYDLTVNTLEGTPAPLAQYKGKVVLVVNVASKCGNTPQYAGLEKLYTEYKDKGFEILGFPSNDFHNQEPGSATEIRAFCTGKYNVTFPLFEKVDVKGPTKAEVYQFLSSNASGAEPDWNFAKYLVDKNGKVVKFFKAKTQPADPALTGAIDAALKG